MKYVVILVGISLLSFAALMVAFGTVPDTEAFLAEIAACSLIGFIATIIGFEMGD